MSAPTCASHWNEYICHKWKMHPHHYHLLQGSRRRVAASRFVRNRNTKDVSVFRAYNLWFLFWRPLSSCSAFLVLESPGIGIACTLALRWLYPIQLAREQSGHSEVRVSQQREKGRVFYSSHEVRRYVKPMASDQHTGHKGKSDSKMYIGSN